MRIRVRFTKLGRVRFVSHRDVARIWERALRRAGVPIAYTEGFSPRPRLHFGLALATGHESVAEYLDLDLRRGEGLPADGLPARINPVLPDGVEVLVAVQIERSEPSLQQAVTSSTWRMVVEGAPEAAVADRIHQILAAPELPVRRERKGKAVTDDVRPAVVALSLVEGHPLGAELEVELRTQPRGLRPAELVALLGAPVEARRVLRLHQWMSLAGTRCEPLPVTWGRSIEPYSLDLGKPLAGSTSRAPHAEVRAR